QVPDLLLSPVGAAPLALHPVVGHVVVQPIARASQNAHMALLEAGLLLQLAVHRLLRTFPGLDAALGELPRVLLDALAPENLVPCVAEHDGDVRAVPVP